MICLDSNPNETHPKIASVQGETCKTRFNH